MRPKKCPQQDQQANWHVNLLAVNPAHQGQQIGSKTLTQFVLPYVKKHGGQQVSLITNTARNVAFYQRNAFQVIDERLLAFQTTHVSVLGVGPTSLNDFTKQTRRYFATCLFC